MDVVTLALAKNGAKAYTDQAIAALGKGLIYKGAVSYYSNLPNNAENGECYTVLYEGESGNIPSGAEYVWGKMNDQSDPEWIYIGPDMNNYLSKNNTISYSPSTDYNPATKKYVDDNKGQTIQYSSMPTVDSTIVGKIVQYIGTTDANYTNGYFYIGTSDGGATPTYSWEAINVQSGSSNNDGIFTLILDFPSGGYDTTTTDTYSLQAASECFTRIRSYIDTMNHDRGYRINIINRQKGSDINTTQIFSTPALWLMPTSIRVYGYYFEGMYDYRPEDTTIRQLQYVFNGSWNNKVFTCTSISYNVQPTKHTFQIGKMATKTDVNRITLETAGLSSYSTSSTYQIGDYVYRSSTDFTIYKCNTADTTGTWDANKWTQTTYMEYLSDTLVGNALGGSY